MKKYTLTLFISLFAFLIQLQAQEPVIEKGLISANSTNWQTVTLEKNYTKPVVVTTPAYPFGSAPAIVRLQNVTGTSFEVKLAMATNNGTDSLTCPVHYFVVEEGTYTVANNGIKMEAVSYNSTVTDYVSSWIGEARTYLNTYTSPVVLGQVMTSNDTRPSVFWSRGPTRQEAPTATVLNTGKHVAADPTITRANETVGYIVIEAGYYNINGLEFTAGVGADTVTGMDDSRDKTYAFTGLTDPESAVLSSAGMDGNDGGWPVLLEPNAIGSNSLSLVIDEDQWSDSERGHATEQASYIAIKKVMPNLIAENGLVSNVSSANWTTVNLTKAYTSPVIVTTPAYPFGSKPAIVRLQNVTGTSFEIKLAMATANGADSLTCPVHYFVVEEGTYTIADHGVKMEAVSYSSTVTDRKNSWTGESRTYSNTYTSPVVFGQVMTSNDSRASVFWASGSSYNNAPSAAALKTGKHVGEDTTTTRLAETVGYIVLEAGEHTIDGLEIVAGLGADIVRGMDNERDDIYTVTGATSLSSAILSAAGMDGGDGGWPVLLDPNSLSANSIQLIFEEDTWGDTERAHATEEVAYLAFNQVAAPSIVVENGTVSVTHTWTTVNLTKTFTDPVVIAGPPEYNETHESVVRIRNVTPTSFQIRVQEWDYLDGSHASEGIDYIVVEKGIHTLSDGRVIEVGSTDLTNTGFSTVNYQSERTAAPVVLSSVMTDNDTAAVTRRMRNIGNTSFQIKLQEEEIADQTHAQESVGYMILDAGDYDIGGLVFTVGTQNGVDEVWDSVPSAGRTHFIATFQTYGGADPGAMRKRGSIGTDLEIYFEEEQSMNTEKGHANETAGYILFGADMTPVSHTVTFAAGANGSLSGDLNQTILDGDSTTAVTAIPDIGYVFSRWDDEDSSNPRIVENVSSDQSFTALFKLIVQPPVSGLISSQDFTFDDLNRRDTVTLNGGFIWDYNYDSLGNLEQAHKAHPTDPAQDLLFNYTFDDIGNRKTAVENGVSKTYTANDIQQYTEVDTDGTIKILTYDDAGNPDQMGDWNLTWDGEDRLKTMTNSITGEKLEFEYDFRGFRCWKKVFDDGTNVSKWIGYVYDGNLVTEEIDLLDPNKKIIRSYTWGLDPAGTKQQVGGIGALVSMEQDNKNYHVVSDAGGNVTNLLESHDDGSLTMANTYEYGPFGQVVAKTESVDMPYQFNTKYTDAETGLVYYGFRFLDTADGRWLNRDPIGVNGGINIYNSVSNNMVNGFSGGLSYSAGMSKEAGKLDTNYWLDNNGLKTFSKEHSYKGKKLNFTFTDCSCPQAIKLMKRTLKAYDAAELARKGSRQLFLYNHVLSLFSNQQKTITRDMLKSLSLMKKLFTLNTPNTNQINHIDQKLWEIFSSFDRPFKYKCVNKNIVAYERRIDRVIRIGKTFWLYSLKAQSAILLHERSHSYANTVDNGYKISGGTGTGKYVNEYKEYILFGKTVKEYFNNPNFDFLKNNADTYEAFYLEYLK